MAGRGGRTALQQFRQTKKIEALVAETNVFDIEKLPRQEPTGLSFREWVDQYVVEVQPKFQWDAATELMAESLEAAILGRSERLLLVPAPRSGKSLLTACAFVWSLFRFPEGNPQIFISASQRLAQNHSRVCLQLFAAAGGKLHPQSRSVQEWLPAWRNAGTQAIIGRSTSCLGLGASRLYIDDCVGSRADSMSPNIMEQVIETFGSSWVSRLQRDNYGKGESILCINQRLSSTDLAAHLIQQGRRHEDSTPWTVVHVPYVHPENRAEALNWYPDHWKVRMLPQGEEGTPTSSRIDLRTVRERQQSMSVAAFKALYLCDVSGDDEVSPWKSHYLRQVPRGELSPGSVVVGLDLAITGKSDGHGYAVVANGIYDCKGKAIVLEAGELRGAVDDLIPQIMDLVRKYKASAVALEKAGGAWSLMRQLNAGLQNFGVQLFTPTASKSKFHRLEEVLGYMSLGNVLVPQQAAWLPVLDQQFRSIAIRDDRARDDIADATIWALQQALKWQQGGFNTTSATWGRAGFREANQGIAVWGRGSHPAGIGGGQYATDPTKPFPGGGMF